MKLLAKRETTSIFGMICSVFNFCYVPLGVIQIGTTIVEENRIGRDRERPQVLAKTGNDIHLCYVSFSKFYSFLHTENSKSRIHGQYRKTH